MHEEEVRSRILAALYEAPLSSERWDDFLKLTALAAGGEAASLLVHDFSNTESAMSREWGFHPDVAKLYAAHYGAIDVWRCAVTASHDWLGTSQRFVSFPALLRTEFCNDLLLRYDIPHGIFAMVERGPGRVANLSICRGACAGAFDEKDLEIVRFLKPHIQRAYRLDSEFSAARSFSTGVLTALDAISKGVFLIGPKRQVIAMNQAAEQIVAASNGLRAGQKGLRTESPTESTRLERLLLEAISTSEGKGSHAAGAMQVSRRDLLPLHLLVCPVRGIDLGHGCRVCAIVFVNDPSLRVRPAPEILRAAFGITAAESRVALLLSDGLSPREIASRIGVSTNTVRSQIKSVFAKTGVKRQGELIRLLLNLGNLGLTITTSGDSERESH